MPNVNIENLFIEHALLIRNDVSKSLETCDFYIQNLAKEQWVDGSGRQYQYPVYERSIPSTPVSFVPFSTLNPEVEPDNNLGSTGGCDVSGSTIDSFGITLKTVSLQKASLNSPDICLDDLQFEWQVMDQVNNIVRVLSENSKLVWTRAYQHEYIAACGNKIIAKSGLPTDSDWNNIITAPTSQLTWGLLEDIHEQLGYNGGSMAAYAKDSEGTPVYAVVGDRYQFQHLKLQDANIRADLHYGDPSATLAGPGIGKTYRGFKFFSVQFAPRYDIVNGAWVERLPYDPADPTSYLNATRGKKAEVGQLYKNAKYTDTVIFLKPVVKMLTPAPKGNYGKMAFNPQYSWSGEFIWRNIPDRLTNIDGNKGFFRALYAYGAKVERPDLGFVIRHLRCPATVDMIGCS